MAGAATTTKFMLQHPIPAPKPIITPNKLVQSPNHNSSILSFCSIKSSPQNRNIYAAAPQNDLLTAEQEEPKEHTTTAIKLHLFSALQGINRGIFGVSSEKKSEIESFVHLLESLNPTPHPTLSLHKIDGNWRLIYTTITILGSKRTKLGLRDFVTLGDLFQSINAAQGKAVNTAKFSARGLSLLSGHLTIEASFKVASNSRVDITYNKSAITPDQLMNVFRKNYDLLLGIFNPEGWLEITYVDDSLRIGRDDKGNIFILERLLEAASDNP
ncbi:hypothetical protein ABFS83_08G098400 [Erythranthe nasuta]